MSYASDPAAYEALLADIAAGIRLHYLDTGSADRDFDLLSGDERFARGLSQLAALGDLDATRVLGDAISAIARAHAEGDADAAQYVWSEAAETVRRSLGSAPGARLRGPR